VVTSVRTLKLSCCPPRTRCMRLIRRCFRLLCVCCSWHARSGVLVAFLGLLWRQAGGLAAAQLDRQPCRVLVIAPVNLRLYQVGGSVIRRLLVISRLATRWVTEWRPHRRTTPFCRRARCGMPTNGCIQHTFWNGECRCQHDQAYLMRRLRCPDPCALRTARQRRR
jgi:hypothetical protein